MQLDQPFSDHNPTQKHADQQTTAAEDDVDRHGYMVGKCSIIQDGYDVEEGDLYEIWNERYCAWLEAGAIMCPDEMVGETIQRDDEELEEGEQRASMGVLRCEVLEGDCVAGER